MENESELGKRTTLVVRNALKLKT